MQQFEPIPTVPPEGRRRAFAYRNFRIYFLGSLISVCGPWMQGTAQAWLVLQLTNSPIALATVTSLQFLPIMLLSLVGGAVADRLPRRRLMFTTQSLAACQAVLLGVLVLTNTVTIWHIYLLAITLGPINALDAPLRQSFVGELVPVETLPNAIALSAMSQNLGRIVGPAIGGLASTYGVWASIMANGLMCGVGMILAYAYLRRVRGDTAFDLGTRPSRVPGAAPVLALDGEGDAVA